MDFSELPQVSDSEEKHKSILDPVQVQGQFKFKSRHSQPVNLTIEVRHSQGLSFQLWASSIVLSEYVSHLQQQNGRDWKDVKVLELGCGAGLVGLTLAKLGANVLLTDQSKVQAMIKNNININECDTKSKCDVLDWNDAQDIDRVSKFDPEVIVASDVVYHRELFQPLLSCLRALLTGNRILLLAHVRRFKYDRQFFKQLNKQCVVQKLDIDLQNIVQHPDLNLDQSSQQPVIYECRARQ